MMEEGQAEKEPYDLLTGIAIARNEFDLVERLSEAELANALRVQAKDLAYPHLLLAIADALDHPDAPIRLKLIQSRRGPRESKQDPMTDLAVAKYVETKLNEGIKQEAAIADIRKALGVSRATVMATLARGRELREAALSIRASVAAAKRTKSS